VLVSLVVEPLPKTKPQSGTRTVFLSISTGSPWKGAAAFGPLRRPHDGVRRVSDSLFSTLSRDVREDRMPASRVVARLRPRPVIHSRKDIAKEVGRALRRARQAREMTLRDVGVASKGQFKPTAVAGYERAERNINVERFCELALLYGMAPERLLSQIIWRVEGRPEPTIERTRIPRLPQQERKTLNGFIRQVHRMRSASEDGTITLRIRDLEVLATISGSRLEEFLKHLRPALFGKDAHSSRV
jgi:transcriptional regulator with XRE-family HTH domain